MTSKRTKTGQKRHDEAILKSEKWYKEHGYKVQVDLPRHKKPKSIKGFIPDLLAKNRREEVVVEFETKETLEKDKEQYAAFQQYANQKKNRRFRRKII